MTDNTRPGGLIDCAAVQYALTVVTGFFLAQTMESFPDEGKHPGLDCQKDDLVVEMLNDIRILAYKQGKVSMPFYAPIETSSPEDSDGQD